MPMNVETYLALGLHLQPPLEVNGRGAADFRLSLDHPGDGAYHPCPEATPDPTVPEGHIQRYREWSDTAIYPGTRRSVWVHTPAGLDRSHPVNLIVFNDGGGYQARSGPVRATRVLDSLHARGQVTPTVAVFVDPGRRAPGAGGPSAHDQPDWEQRRAEYDPLTPTHGRFLIEELLPDIERREGLTFSRDPAARTICGISSGGICAFTAAWFHPEAFGRVLSHCGSFVNIDGGHNYPFLVRSTSRRPIRVFLQSGENDGRNVYGDWPLANRVMANALEFAGYDVRFEFGTGGHTLRHAGAIFAESLRWLWR
jgi:enterochelin esterase family protein